jgi:hypothetical protein
MMLSSSMPMLLVLMSQSRIFQLSRMLEETDDKIAVPAHLFLMLSPFLQLLLFGQQHLHLLLTSRAG